VPSGSHSSLLSRMKLAVKDVSWHRRPALPVFLWLRVKRRRRVAVLIRLVNVGLVRDASLTTTAFSMIMGPNNSGKSTAATALYAAVKVGAALASRPRSAGTLWASQSAGGSAVVDGVIRALDVTPDAVVAQERLLTAIRAQVEPVMKAVIEDFGRRFIKELEVGLGATLADVATHDLETGRRLPLKIIVESQQPAWTVTIRLRGDKPSVTAAVIETVTVDPDRLPLFALRLPGPPDEHRTTELRYIAFEFVNQVGSATFASWPAGAHYLPAARAGLLQSHRLVAAAMFQRSPMVGLGEVSMPSLSGVVADFVSEILLSQPKRAPFAKFAKQIEQEVLSGSVRQVSTETGYPEIEFTDAHGSYPVHRTSSMVSELAPIVLLLQRSIAAGDLLLIEEPESHLHPATQVTLAKVLFQLAQSGVLVFVTTHSDFFVSEVNNLLRSRVINGDIEASSSSSAYWMEKGVDGSRLRPLEIDPVDGISDDSFAAVAASLYETQVDQQLSLVGEA